MGGAVVAEGVGGVLAVDVVDCLVGAGYGDWVRVGVEAVGEVDDCGPGLAAGCACCCQAEEEGECCGEGGELHFGSLLVFEVVMWE